jgi:hypothetical protein
MTVLAASSYEIRLTRGQLRQIIQALEEQLFALTLMVQADEATACLNELQHLRLERNRQEADRVRELRTALLHLLYPVRL